MTMFQAEMSFDAWQGDKVPPPGGVPTSYVDDRAVPQPTKQGAKGTRPYNNGNVASIIDAINPPGGEPAEPTGVYSYEQGSNVLTAITGSLSSTFVTDDNGNIISENNRVYGYDLLNRLITVSDGGNQIAAYTYNAMNQRMKKVTGAGTKVFHYDQQGRLIAETNQSGQTLVEYIYLGDQPLAMIRPTEQVYYYHNDHLGTPRVLTGAGGSVVWKALYAPFGKVTITTATVENNLRFPGQYYDAETGLHYNWNRYYDPKTGRYITPDPIGLDGGINLYPYVENNPLSKMDLEGKMGKIPPLDKVKKIYDGTTCGIYQAKWHEAARECHKKCDKEKPTDVPLEAWARYLDQYGGGNFGSDDATLHCVCDTLRLDKSSCREVLENCIGLGIGLPKKPKLR